MADPVTTMAVVGMTTAAAGSIFGAVGATNQGAAQQQMNAYQAGIAQVNSTIDKQNASWALETGEVEALKSGQKTGFTVATEKTAQSGSGLDVNTGSAAAVRDSTLKIGQIDQGIIKTNSARRAYGFTVEAAAEDAEAVMDITAGDNAVKAGTLGAVTSLLGGASSVSSKWIQGSQAGMFSSSGAAVDGMGNPI